MTTNPTAQILPAVFGLLGTIVGALISQRGAANQRRAESDAKARAQLASFTQAAAAYVYPRQKRPTGDPWFDYLDAKDNAFIALLAARVPRDVADWILTIPHPKEKSEPWRQLNSSHADDIFQILDVQGIRRRGRIARLRRKMAQIDDQSMVPD
jgi:hypothetical protein